MNASQQLRKETNQSELSGPKPGVVGGGIMRNHGAVSNSPNRRKEAGHARTRSRPSPLGGAAKGVQFEPSPNDIRDEFVNLKIGDARSSSTEPLVTDSFSSDEIDSYRDTLGNKPSMPIVHMYQDCAEQTGYDSRRLNRMRKRREHELEEFNYGIDFSQLRTSKEQQARLREYLLKQQNKLNEYVEQGSGPIFGYPPICYSPPNEFKQEKVDKKEYLDVFMRHVF